MRAAAIVAWMVASWFDRLTTRVIRRPRTRDDVLSLSKDGWWAEESAEERSMGRQCWVVALVLAMVGCSPAVAQAPDAASIAGTYCLRGVMEVGSCLRFHPDGRFEYFLAYGAYDENAEGTWKLEGGSVVLDTPAYDRPARFAFKRLQKSDSGAYDVIVEAPNGRAIAGIDVRATCDGRTFNAGVTQAQGYSVECRSAPTAIALGLRMYGIGYQAIDVSSHAGADRAYVFGFDPGDLGRKRFTGHRLEPRDGALVMIYRDTPIAELDGRPFRYVRE
jgi:hypothetical protein